MPQPSRISFAEFEFDPATGELWHGGRRVPLQPQPARLLELFVARPGEVIARDEIRQALWGDETHVEFDRSLNFCVAKLRSALHDNPAVPRYIETVPTRGYRFIAAPLLPGSDPGVVPRVAVSARGEDVARRRNRYLVAAAAVLFVAAAAAFAVLRPDAATPKVVVVPFHNETGAPDLDRVAKGVSDATVV